MLFSAAPLDAEHTQYTITLNNEIDQSSRQQLDILLRALEVFDLRNNRYTDHWKDLGWRGCLFHIRRKSERAFRQFWNWNPYNRLDSKGNAVVDVDDILDLINYAVMCVRLLEEGTLKSRNGIWWDVIDAQQRHGHR